MSKSQNEVPDEIESQFILRLPPEHAYTVRNLIRSQSVDIKDKLKIDLPSNRRHAVVEVEGVQLAAKLIDLPCVIECLKTDDKKTFYKTADISQMLVCTADGDLHSSPEEPTASTDPNVIRKNESESKEEGVTGVTPPLKNVKKKRFQKRKTKFPDVKEMEEISSTENIGSPDVVKEVQRLLRLDAEAISTRYEIIAEDGTKEIESQGSIPGFVISSGMNSDKQNHISSVMETQKQICKKEKKLHEIQNKAQRQKDLIMKVENLALKNHFQSVLEQLWVQEKKKNEELISLQEKLQCFLKK
uniref:TATA-box binding protein associated factor 7 like n=1 Tax=Aotus nancymaae TaxID=37293 RepID=A0A2K5EAB9_AOTNA